MSCRIDWPSLARAFHKIIRGFAGRLALRLIDGASKVINSQVANMFGVKSKTLAEQGLAVAYCRVLLRSQSLHGCSPWVRRIILGSIRCHQGAHDMAPRIDALKLHDAVWPLGHVIDASPGRSFECKVIGSHGPNDDFSCSIFQLNTIWRPEKSSGDTRTRTTL